ncbi:MAG: MFS transporter [Chloroflexi bacterium]|nr:MFS transporter [Chloroflexota bacterium]MCL5075605.1 MFS transporter [Chloroflexota bacterium]
MSQHNPEIGTTSVLRNRHFLFLWLAQAITQTAQNAIWFGLIVVVEDQSRSSMQLSIAILSSIIPSIALGMIAGVFVDRMRKKMVLLTTNLLRAIVALGYLLYGYSLVPVYLINLLFCSISQFFAPAEAATIPLLVSKRQLITANSLFNLTFTASQVVGFVVLAPPLIKFFGAQSLFIISSLIYVVATLLVSLLPKEEDPHRRFSGLQGGTLVSKVWMEIREGWQFITADRRTALAMVHLTLAACLMLVLAMLTPRYVVAVLNIRADDAVYIFAPAGVGVLLGTMMMGRLADKFGKSLLVNGGLIGMGSSLFLMASLYWIGRHFALQELIVRLGLSLRPSLSGLVPAVMIISFILGYAFALTTIPSQTILMERAPASTRGRIFAVQIMLGNLASVLPLLFLGSLADLFGINKVIAFVGLVVLAIAVLSIREVRRLMLGTMEVGIPTSRH